MKLLSWNVNGIRAILKKDFLNWFKQENPDILCIQEIKANRDQLQLETPGYHQYWNSADKKGYSGTLILAKTEPLSVQYDMEDHDQEGRIITLEFDDYFLVNVYVPNAQRTLDRLPYRQQWDKDFLEYLKELEQMKPVIACGDFNVCHKEIDLARPKQNEGNAGFTAEERAGFDAYVKAGFIDTFRHLYPDKIEYSWWAYMFNARAKNIGWRIDYFIMSKSMKKDLKDAFILTDVMGSDHCPVGILLRT